MKCVIFILALAGLLATKGLSTTHDVAITDSYLKTVKNELRKQWPQSHPINIVFHGHSVPAGYSTLTVVNTFSSYPQLLLRRLKAKYPYAVINIIVTAIGGENSAQGDTRFRSDVLTHKPDVLLIDYGLNDRALTLAKARQSWQDMIEQAQKSNIKVILLTPNADLGYKAPSFKTTLAQNVIQIRQLAKQYHIGLVDSYALFQAKVAQGEPLRKYLTDVAHPNVAGHTLIADELMKWF
ncbi:SGNH/GDSL hydrolase family protein [Spirosoma flavus]